MQVAPQPHASENRVRVHDPAEPADLPLERLEHELCTLSSHLEAGMARWLALLAEYDRRDGWWSWHGVRSVAEWIAWRCSVSPRAAREHVRVARALRELPLIAAAFSRGELSYSKVRPLSRVATEGTEADLIELARHATAAQLERILRGYERVTREAANASEEEREVWWHWDSDGSLIVGARLPADQGMAFLRALETSRAHIRDEARAEVDGDGSAEPRSDDDPPVVGSPATNADALVRVAEAYLARGPTPVKGAERHHVIVHIDAEDSSTRAGSRCDTKPAGWCFGIRVEIRSIPSRCHHRATMRRFGAATASPDSRSARRPCSPAPARG